MFEMYPREGFQLWVAGMGLVVSSPELSRCGDGALLHSGEPSADERVRQGIRGLAEPLEG